MSDPTFQGFAAFVNSKPDAESIEHRAKDWTTCAVGQYLTSCGWDEPSVKDFNCLFDTADNFLYGYNNLAAELNNPFVARKLYPSYGHLKVAVNKLLRKHEGE